MEVPMLISDINQLKKHLLQLLHLCDYNLLDKQVLKISQQLDEKITQYIRITCK